MSPPVAEPPAKAGEPFVGLEPVPPLQVKNDEPNVVFPPFPPAVGEPIPLPPAPPPPPTMRTKMALTLAGVVYVPDPEVNV
jgi:hypothetical protein